MMIETLFGAKMRNSNAMLKQELSSLEMKEDRESRGVSQSYLVIIEMVGRSWI